MKTINLSNGYSAVRLLTAVVAVWATSASAYADIFGSGANTFDIQFVTIGNSGNPADTTGVPNPAGSVAYTYRMGKFETSEQMIDKANTLAGLGINEDTRGADKPATSVSWNQAARFVNWLNTSTGSAPAYKFATQPGQAGYDANAFIQLWTPGDTGYNQNNLYRNSQARYVLPSDDEWYKAAYYDPTSGNYFDFPTGSNVAPTAVASGTAAGTAVYDGQSGPADITLAGGLSPYGTMAQGGNAYEFEETDFDLVNDLVEGPNYSSRGLRGGSWFNPSTPMSSSFRSFFQEGTALNRFGFRVASTAIPEPSSGVLGVIACSLMWRRRKRFK